MPTVKQLSVVENHDFTDEWYDFASEDHFWMQWRCIVLESMLRSLNVSLDKKLSVLEVGCGQGVLLKQIESASNWKITGADLNLAALKGSVSKTCELLCYDVLTKNRNYKEYYDVIFLMDVLEHIENPIEFTRACLYHLKSNGILLINVPALESMFSIYDTAMGHLRRYNKSSLKSLIADLPCEHLALSYWGLTMLPLLALRKAFLLNYRDTQQIIKDGFKPPGRFAHKILKMMMKIECSLLVQPPIGTSVMCAVRKTV